VSTVKVAAAQIRPVLFSLDGSLQRVLDAMAEAAAEGVELIVFPETFLPYYPYFSFVEPPVLMGRSHLALYDRLWCSWPSHRCCWSCCPSVRHAGSVGRQRA